jgi:thiamine pyrophosphokinase
MGTCIIFCAAEFHGLVVPITQDDFVIAADGGLAHAEKLGIIPNGILGDFDSLGYTPQGAKVFPVEKDDTDAMLAVRQGLKMGFTDFILYGSLDGDRLDHTVANFQTLQFLADHGARGVCVGNRYIAAVIKNETVKFPRSAEGILSVFCMGADAKGVSITGTKYEAENITLTAGFPLGVSNHFVGKESRITVTDGSLLLLYDRQNGLPERI